MAEEFLFSSIGDKMGHSKPRISSVCLTAALNSPSLQQRPGCAWAPPTSRCRSGNLRVPHTESWLLSACSVGRAVVTYPKPIIFSRSGSSFKNFFFKFGKTIQLHKGGGDAKTSIALQHLVLSKRLRGRHLKIPN